MLKYMNNCSLMFMFNTYMYTLVMHVCEDPSSQKDFKVFDLTEVKKSPYLVKKTPELSILANTID